MVDVTGAFLGPTAEADELFEPLRSVVEPMIDTFAQIPAPELCRIYGDPEQPTPGMTHQTVLREFTEGTVDALVDAAGPASGSPLLMVGLRHLGGAAASAPSGAGVLGSIEGEYAMYGVGVPMAPEMAPAIEAHLDLVVSAMAPWSTGRDYLNLADRPCDASAAFDVDTYRRLSEVKGRLDPDDLFRSDHPVRPARVSGCSPFNPKEEEQMADSSVYRVTEVIGLSSEGWAEAAANAVAAAGKTVRDLRVAEVVRQDVTIQEGAIVNYRVRLAISFKYESGE